MPLVLGSSIEFFLLLNFSLHCVQSLIDKTDCKEAADRSRSPPHLRFDFSHAIVDPISQDYIGFFFFEFRSSPLCCFPAPITRIIHGCDCVIKLLYLYTCYYLRLTAYVLSPSVSLPN
jgi:hypothetical protein